LLVAAEAVRQVSAGGTDPRIGEIVAGDLEIRAVLGAGAMGRVYRAHQRSVDRDVAIKILHRELSANPDIVRRFHRREQKSPGPERCPRLAWRGVPSRQRRITA